MTVNSPIRNVIFDLGGVLLNIDYQLTIEAFKQLGVHHFQALYSQAQQTDLFNALETGKITPTAFCDGIRTVSGLSFTNESIIDAWNAMLLDFPDERVVFLSEMSKKYRIFLLSNTNQIHLEAFTKIIQKQHGLAHLNPLFEQVYYSHMIGLRKPHPEVFEYVCKDSGLSPAETLFIDDSIQHVEGAKKAGLTAIHLDVKKQTVIESLDFLR